MKRRDRGNERLLMQKSIVEAHIEAMGMQAENLHRQDQGLSMAYTEDDFAEVIDRLNRSIEYSKPVVLF